MLKIVCVLVFLDALNTCFGSAVPEDDWRKKGFYRPRRNYQNQDQNDISVQSIFNQRIQNQNNQRQNTFQTKTTNYNQYSIGQDGFNYQDRETQSIFKQAKNNQNSEEQSAFRANFGQNFQNQRTIGRSYNENSQRTTSFGGNDYNYQNQNSLKSSYSQESHSQSTFGSLGHNNQTLFRPNYSQKPQIMDAVGHHSTDYESKKVNLFETRHNLNFASQTSSGTPYQNSQNQNPFKANQKIQDRYSFSTHNRNFQSAKPFSTRNSFSQNSFEFQDVTSNNSNFPNSNSISVNIQNSYKGPQYLLPNVDLVPPYRGPAYIPPKDTSYIASTTNRPFYISTTTRRPFYTTKSTTRTPFYTQSTTTQRPYFTSTTTKPYFTSTTTKIPFSSPITSWRSFYSTSSTTRQPYFTSTTTRRPFSTKSTPWRTFYTTNLTTTTWKPFYTSRTTTRPFPITTPTQTSFYTTKFFTALPAMAMKVLPEPEDDVTHESEEELEDSSESNRNSGTTQFTTTTSKTTSRTDVTGDGPPAMAMKVPHESEEELEDPSVSNHDSGTTQSTTTTSRTTSGRTGGGNNTSESNRDSGITQSYTTTSRTTSRRTDRTGGGPPSMAMRVPHESEEELEDSSGSNRNSGTTQSTTTTSKTTSRTDVTGDGPPAMAMKVPHESEEELEDPSVSNPYSGTTQSYTTISRTTSRRTDMTGGGPPSMAMRVPHESEEDLEGFSESNRDSGTTQSTTTTSRTTSGRTDVTGTTLSTFATRVGTTASTFTTASLRVNVTSDGPPAMAMRVPHESEEDLEGFSESNRDSGTTQSTITTSRTTSGRTGGGKNASESNRDSGKQSSATNITITSIQINTISSGPPAMAMKVPHETEEGTSELDTNSGVSQSSAANLTLTSIQIGTRNRDPSTIDSGKDIATSTQMTIRDILTTTTKPSSINVTTSLTDSILVDIIKSLLVKRSESKVIVREPIVQRIPAFFLVLQAPPDLEYDADFSFPFDAVSRRSSTYLSRIPYIRRKSSVSAYSRILGLEELDKIQRQVWHVVIYEKADVSSEICGGSIIRADVVISDVYCFLLDGDDLQPAELFEVTASRIYRSWERRGTSVQTSDVVEIKIDPRFGEETSQEMAILKLATPFRYTPGLRPISVNFGEAFEMLLRKKHRSTVSYLDSEGTRLQQLLRPETSSSSSLTKLKASDPDWSSLDTEELLGHLDSDIRRRILEEVILKYSKHLTRRRFNEGSSRSAVLRQDRRQYLLGEDYDYDLK